MTARGPDMEADVDIELSCALLCPMLGSTWGGRGEAPEPPDLYAIRKGMAGKALFCRWWLLLLLLNTAAEVNVVAKAIKSTTLS